jgi:hypothetical protein
MSKVIVTVLTIFGVMALSGEAFAQQKKCPKGTVYNAKTEKCVTPRRPTPRGSF